MRPIRLTVPLLVILCWPLTASAQIDVTQFDRWIFNGPERTDQAWKALIDAEIFRLEQSVELTDAQKEKISFAGRGDIKRFMDRVEAARRAFHALDEDLGQNHFNEAYQLAAPLQQELTAGLFRPVSLLQKVARSMLSVEQKEQLHNVERQRRKTRTESTIKLVLAKMSRQVPMTHTQRQWLLEYAIEHTPPLRTSSPYASYYVQYHLGKVRPTELEQMFDDKQQAALRVVLRRGANMRGMLKQAGLLDDE